MEVVSFASYPGRRKHFPVWCSSQFQFHHPGLDTSIYLLGLYSMGPRGWFVGQTPFRMYVGICVFFSFSGWGWLGGQLPVWMTLAFRQVYLWLVFSSVFHLDCWRLDGFSSRGSRGWFVGQLPVSMSRSFRQVFPWWVFSGLCYMLSGSESSFWFAPLVVFGGRDQCGWPVYFPLRLFWQWLWRFRGWFLLFEKVNFLRFFLL